MLFRSSSLLKEPRVISTLAAWPTQALVHNRIAILGSKLHQVADKSLFRPQLPTQALAVYTLWDTGLTSQTFTRFTQRMSRSLWVQDLQIQSFFILRLHQLCR